MKRTLSLLLAFVLALGCLSPALAAEGETATFSDVSPEAWYAQAVELCAEKGIMVGTGEGVFSPDETLSFNQCVTLALRLYDLLHGGDGVFEPAPEPEPKNRLTLTLADGTQLTSSGFTRVPLPGQEPAEFYFYWGGWRHDEYGYLCAVLCPDPALEDDSPEYRAANEALSQWGDAHEGAATVTLNGQTISGTVDCWVPTNWVLAFHPDDGDSSESGMALHEALYTADATDAFPADAWWRDGAFYLTQHEELVDQLFFLDEDEPATRWNFADALFSAARELPAARQVDVPDLDRDFSPATAAYALYDAGILTGKDAYGTFDGEGQLTRAQAAVMVARVLDEGQRVTAPLEPLPTEGYTLTYLMDGAPDCGINYPVCVLGGSEENQDPGILLLDGTLLPWPEGGTPSYALEPNGDYVYFGVYDETTPDPADTRCGLMDRSGAFVVPMENGRTVNTYATEDGFFSEITRPDGTTAWTLLDEQGRLIREVPVEPGSVPDLIYPPKGRSPYRGIEDRAGDCYVDAAGTPVSQRFDWAGHITDDGQGFVGIDGKIYRIDFAQ